VCPNIKINITFYFLSACWSYILHSTNIWKKRHITKHCISFS